MKERARKKLDKALAEACSTIQEPGKPIASVINRFAQVLARCGSAPYEGCEETAAETMALMSLAYLQIAEEHLVVNVIRRNPAIALNRPEPGLGGESWPGLADKAADYAQRALGCRLDRPEMSALTGLLDAVVRRAGEVKQEPAPAEPRVVEHMAYSSVVYVPEGIAPAAYMATGLSKLQARDVREYVRVFPNGEWLLSALGCGG